MKISSPTVLIASVLLCAGCTTTPDVPSEITALSKSGASDLKDFVGIFQAEGKWLGEMALLQEKNRRLNPNYPNVAPNPRYYDLLSIAHAPGRKLHSADRFSIELIESDILRITAFRAREAVVSEEFKRSTAFEYRDGVITLLHREQQDSPGYLTKRTDVSLSLNADHDLIVTRREAGLAGWLIVIVPVKSNISALFKKETSSERSAAPERAAGRGLNRPSPRLRPAGKSGHD
jgi:hypothetical protein